MTIKKCDDDADNYDDNDNGDDGNSIDTNDDDDNDGDDDDGDNYSDVVDDDDCDDDDNDDDDCDDNYYDNEFVSGTKQKSIYITLKPTHSLKCQLRFTKSYAILSRQMQLTAVSLNFTMKHSGNQ